MRMISLALASAVILAPSGGAMAQASSASPPATPPPNSQILEKEPPAVPGEPGTRSNSDAPRDMTNPQPPPAAGETVASEARIRSMLEKQGYANVQNIRREGDAYTATATKDGEGVNIRIDPQLGQIQEHGG